MRCARERQHDRRVTRLELVQQSNRSREALDEDLVRGRTARIRSLAGRKSAGQGLRPAAGLPHERPAGRLFQSEFDPRRIPKMRRRRDIGTAFYYASATTRRGVYAELDAGGHREILPTARNRIRDPVSGGR